MITRRTFLKGVASGVAYATIPGLSLAGVEKQPVIPDKVREITAYEISSDEIVTRFDVLDEIANIQLDISFVTTGKWRDKNKMDEVRKKAYKELTKGMAKRGMKWKNLIKLPIPDGIVSLTETRHARS